MSSAFETFMYDAVTSVICDSFTAHQLALACYEKSMHDVVISVVSAATNSPVWIGEKPSSDYISSVLTDVALEFCPTAGTIDMLTILNKVMNPCQ